MTTQEVVIHRVLNAIEAVRQGGMVIMVDDEDRENEGDLVLAAAHVCPEKINFMAKEARGLICLSLDGDTVERLKLPMMEDTAKRNGAKSTAFTVSIEARSGVTTGISAADRAHTIKVATNSDATSDDIVVPGHVFPLKAQSGGVLQRAGHTEGSVDLVRLAGLRPAAVICEIMNDDGSMARVPDLERFGKRHDIPIVSIADLITFRLQRESLVETQRRAPIKTSYGTFDAVLFLSQIDGLTHLALTKLPTAPDGGIEAEIVDVRVHRQRPLVDVFGDATNGGKSRLEYGLKMLKDTKAGILLYLAQQDSRSSMDEDFAALAAEATGQVAMPAKRPWVEQDPRMLGVGAQILRHLGVRRMRVHMSQPVALKGLSAFDLEVIETVHVPSGRVTQE